MSTRRPGRPSRSRRVAPPKTPDSGKKPAGRGGAPAKPASPAKAAKPGAAAAPAAPVDPLIGRVLGRCRIESRIGQGRTSIVYRARHEALDRTVAVKVLLPRAAANPQLVERFQTEARAIAKIDNENVLKIYDVGTEGSLHFIVMELLEGEEVFDLVTREGRLEVMDALRIVRQAANGLVAAHARHIVHRDMKPQNLVLLEDGTVKVVDFGLAASLTEGGTERVGTPHFMAPETCESGATSEASDIYSLGITLYLLLVGQPPHSGQDVPSILKSHIRAEPLRPETKRPGLPREIADLVRRLTAKDAQARPVAKALLDDLDRFGGEAIQEKGTLRRRSARMRSHIAARRSAGAGPMVLAVLLVVGAIVAIIALTSGKGGDEKEKSARPPAPAAAPTAPPPATAPGPSATPPGPTPGAAPQETPPPPPPPPPAQSPESAARDALAAVEDWARAHWKSAEDDRGVVSRYNQVAKDHPDTEAGKEAQQRAFQIRAGQLHAHPDMALANAAALEAAQKAWDEAKPKIEDLVAKHRYLEARELVPVEARDDRGSLGEELRFWNQFLTHLMEFQTEVTVLVPKLPEEARLLKLPQGEALITRISPSFITVDFGTEKKELLWADVPADQIAKLARKAFSGASAAHQLHALAFAAAHHLTEAFYAAEYDLSQSEGVPDQAWILERYRDLMK